MRNLEPGFKVVGSDGKEIGTIANCGRDYCEVNTGVLGLGHPVYVPMEAVRDTEGNTVYLNVPSDQLDEKNWQQPPEGVEGTCHPAQAGQPAEQGVTYAGTIPAAPLPTAPTAEPTEVAPQPPTFNLQTIQRGWPVFCSDGKQVGTVADVRPDSLVMSRGWFIFQHKVMVPRDAVSRVENDRVYLNVGCNTVNRFRSV